VKAPFHVLIVRFPTNLSESLPSGATHFGGELAGGAAGYMKGQQQQVENNQNQQQLQSESVKGG
jgi:hypothetical protein